MLPRVLEPEVMDQAQEARDYDAMDHGPTNRAFVEDLLQACPDPHDALDVGAGTAQIAVELCRSAASCRVMAADLSVEMLELARYHIEVSGLSDRVQLDHCDAKQMPYPDGMFDLVICNGMLHHIPHPLELLRESVRVCRGPGWLFFRDLLRPAEIRELDRLVETHAGQATQRQQTLFRQSLHAALNLDEIRALVAELGFAADTAQQTSDRHWTWSASRGELALAEPAEPVPPVPPSRES